MNIITYCRQRRQYNNLTQLQLAQKSGINQGAISDIENGHREVTTKTILRLSNALGLSPADMFTPPPFNIAKLGRHQIDALAKNIISGNTSIGMAQNQLCQDIASLLVNKLKAHKVKGAKRNTAIRWNTASRYLKAKEKYPPEILAQILHRVDKLLS